MVPPCLLTGELQEGFQLSLLQPFATLTPVAVFAISGYFGVSLVMLLIRSYGAFLTVTITNLRKFFTILLSFWAFPKPFHPHFIIGALLVASGLYMAGLKPNIGDTTEDTFRLYASHL